MNSFFTCKEIETLKIKGIFDNRKISLYFSDVFHTLDIINPQITNRLFDVTCNEGKWMISVEIFFCNSKELFQIFLMKNIKLIRV